MMTKQRPRTEREVMELPVFQQFLTETYDVSELKISDGKAWVRGRLYPIDPRCKSLTILVANELLEAIYHEPDDIIGCSDEAGFFWRIVKNKEGYWFRVLQL